MNYTKIVPLDTIIFKGYKIIIEKPNKWANYWNCVITKKEYPWDGGILYNTNWSSTSINSNKNREDIISFIKLEIESTDNKWINK